MALPTEERSARPVKKVQVVRGAPKATALAKMPAYKQSTKPNQRQEDEDVDSLRTMPRFSAPPTSPTPAQLVNAPAIPQYDNTAGQYSALDNLRQQYQMRSVDVAAPIARNENIYAGAAQDAADQIRKKRLANLAIPVRLMTGHESVLTAPALTRMPAYNNTYGSSALQYMSLTAPKTSTLRTNALA